MTRQNVYYLLMTISAALILGRILAVDRVDVQQIQISRLVQVQATLDAKEERLRKQSDNEEAIRAELNKTRNNLVREAKLESPMFCGNDRSRWGTIRALVEPDMRVIRTETKPDGTKSYHYVWYAIDKVQNLKGWDTIDMVKHGFSDRPDEQYLFSSKPPLLPTLMAIPYAAIYWGSGQRLSLENDPYFVVRSMLILLNLLPLVFCWHLLAKLIDRFGTTDWGRVFCVAFVCFGTFISTFAVTLNNHLPAVVVVTIAFYCAVRILFDDEKRFRYYFTAGLAAAFAVVCELPALSFCVFLGLILLGHAWKSTLSGYLPATMIVLAAFLGTNYIAHQTVVAAYGQRSWYFYEYEREGRVRDSYWKNPVGIDQGEPDRGMYIIHSTVGHHGLFSLTPVWLLAFAGLEIWCFQTWDRRRRTLALMILALSLIVFAFYMSMGQGNRNYGGMCPALRWMFWFIPLWSVPLVSAADSLSRYAAGRILCLACLVVSVFSASYPVWNPWTQSWIYYLLNYARLG